MKQSILIGIALLLGPFAGCNAWAGFGFDASGPEMPRLRQIMLLKPGMTVADVGAGKGELAFALARDVGPTGRVYANDVNLERLAALRAEVAKRNLANVTIVEAKPRETGLPAACSGHCARVDCSWSSISRHRSAGSGLGLPRASPRTAAAMESQQIS